MDNGWISVKPEFLEECVLLTATWFKSYWEYNLWLIQKVHDGLDGWYWGLLCSDGEEWGDIADLKADLYKILEPLPQPPKTSDK